MRLLILAVLITTCFTDRIGANQAPQASTPDAATELQHAGEVLEARFPQSFEDWEFVKEMPVDAAQLKPDGAGRYISRLFKNKKTGTELVVFALCAAPHYAVDGHAPEALLSGGGFTAGPAERQSITLKNGRTAEVFTRTYRKQGQTLRVLWAYGGDGKWIAPQIHRIELAGRATVYKLYAVSDATRISIDESTAACNDFLSTLLPMLDETPFDDKAASSKDSGNAAGKLMQQRQ